MNKILVTGGLGTIGNHLVGELRKRGYTVWMVDLRHHHDPQYLRCDIASMGQLEQVFSNNDFDVVFHLAAEFGRWNGEDYYDTLWRSNVIGTKNILRLQERLGFRLIFSSSSEVYGDYQGIMTEDIMDNIEVKQLNDYALTKWVNEIQIMNSEKMFSTQSVRVRLFNTYGPGEFYSPYRSVNCKFCYRLLHNLPVTVYRGHKRTSTYITDAVYALANILENFIPGEVYNIGGGDFHDIETLAEYVLDETGADPVLVHYEESEPFTTKVKQVDNRKAKRDLNFRISLSLKEGISKTVEWMRKVYQPGNTAPLHLALMKTPPIPIKLE